MTYVQLESRYKPVDKALADISAAHGLPMISGGSGKGWSYWSTLQKCPYAFYLKYVEPMELEDTEEPFHMAVGSVVHALLAWHYLPPRIAYGAGGKKLTATPGKLKSLLEAAGCNPEVIYTAWRVYSAYDSRYEDDYLQPLAVEFPALDPLTGYTCRYDMIAEVGKGAPQHMERGVYIVEAKTASTFTRDTLEGWNMDGEILGEIALWDRSGAQRRFGKLTGLMVNILGKQKTPQFHRYIVVPKPAWSELHLQNLNYLAALERRLRKRTALGKPWPRYNSSCIHRYGRCFFHDHCSQYAS
jgi:hypothetical protein